MSDAYGNLVVSFSEDFEGNKSALCAVLNELGSHTGWCNSDGQFVEEAGKIRFKQYGYGAQYPTVFVKHITGFTRYNEEGQVVQFLTIEEVKDADAEIFDELEPEVEEMSLSEICRILSKHITAGSFSVSACATEKGFHHYFENLTINSNESGERFRHGAHIGYAPESFFEKC
jgi:hypothetical protein